MSLLRTVLFCSPLLLAGCVGSNVPYKPGYQERPAQVTVEDEFERELRLAVPVEIERNEWYLRQGRKAVGRILESVPRNPWNAYEGRLADMGPDEGEVYATFNEQRLMRDLGPRHVPAYVRGRERRALATSAPPEEEGGGGGDEDSEDGGGDEDEDW